MRYCRLQAVGTNDAAGAHGRLRHRGFVTAIDEISIHNLAWEFLTTEFPFDGTDMRPLDVLKAGDIERVVAVAQSWGQGDIF